MDLGKKMISVEQALSLVKSNDHIVSALAPAEGAAFLGSLHTIADRVKNVTVTSCLPMGNFEYMTNRAYADSFNVDGWFVTPALRKAMPNGNVSHVPQQLSTLEPSRTASTSTPSVEASSAPLLTSSRLTSAILPPSCSIKTQTFPICSDMIITLMYGLQ